MGRSRRPRRPPYARGRRSPTARETRSPRPEPSGAIVGAPSDETTEAPATPRVSGPEAVLLGLALTALGALTAPASLVVVIVAGVTAAWPNDTKTTLAVWACASLASLWVLFSSLKHAPHAGDRATEVMAASIVFPLVVGVLSLMLGVQFLSASGWAAGLAAAGGLAYALAAAVLFTAARRADRPVSRDYLRASFRAQRRWLRVLLTTPLLVLFVVCSFLSRDAERVRSILTATTTPTPTSTVAITTSTTGPATTTTTTVTPTTTARPRIPPTTTPVSVSPPAAEGSSREQVDADAQPPSAQSTPESELGLTNADNGGTATVTMNQRVTVTLDGSNWIFVAPTDASILRLEALPARVDLECTRHLPICYANRVSFVAQGPGIAAITAERLACIAGSVCSGADLRWTFHIEVVEAALEAPAGNPLPPPTSSTTSTTTTTLPGTTTSATAYQPATTVHRRPSGTVAIGAVLSSCPTRPSPPTANCELVSRLLRDLDLTG